VQGNVARRGHSVQGQAQQEQQQQEQQQQQQQPLLLAVDEDVVLNLERLQVAAASSTAMSQSTWRLHVADG